MKLLNIKNAYLNFINNFLPKESCLEKGMHYQCFWLKIKVLNQHTWNFKYNFCTMWKCLIYKLYNFFKYITNQAFNF